MKKLIVVLLFCGIAISTPIFIISFLSVSFGYRPEYHSFWALGSFVAIGACLAIATKMKP